MESKGRAVVPRAVPSDKMSPEDRSYFDSYSSIRIHEAMIKYCCTNLQSFNRFVSQRYCKDWRISRFYAMECASATRQGLVF